MPPNEGRVAGGCLCGGVRFEVELPLLQANHCHCTRCRKHSGHSGCVQGQVPRERFQLLSGEDRVRVYGRGEGAVKAFCVDCGSSLFGGRYPEGRWISIRLGAFDGDPGLAPLFHTYVDDRAAWDEIRDDLPRYSAGWTRDAEPDR